MLRRHARSGPLVHYHIITSAVARAGQKRNELLVHADGSRRVESRSAGSKGQAEEGELFSEMHRAAGTRTSSGARI
jgi:hypothetical protein